MASTINEQMVISTPATDEKPPIAYDGKAQMWRPLDLWLRKTPSPVRLSAAASTVR